jgi:NAD(P)-dependent dehydrogenase (short-subunit alcohol dehydrogenase family)
MTNLTGKIAVITGGTGGLGKVVVTEFLRNQATVITTHTGNTASKEFIEETKKKYTQFFSESVDVTSKVDVESFFQKTSAQHKRVDILLNLAGGISKKNLIEEISENEWNTMISLNLSSALYAMQVVLPVMKKNSFGRIVNIAAMTAILPESMKGAYAVSKAGLIALTQTAAEEVRKTEHNITVNAIAPSIISTEENKKWGSPDEVEKWVTPKEITETILHLCSENTRSINGQIIKMYGKVSI